MPDSELGKKGWAFVVLLGDEDDSSGLARLLDDVRMPESATPAVFVSPPVRGMDFFADDNSQASLDKWWANEVPGDATPVYMLMHEDGLVEWIKGVDGVVYVGTPPNLATDDYKDHPDWHTFNAGGPLDFATVIMRDFSKESNDENDPYCIFEHGEAMRMAALSSDFPIDLDDSAFDFGPPPEAAMSPAGYQSPYGAPPSPFGAPPGQFGAPPFGSPPPFGAPQQPFPPAPPAYPQAAPAPAIPRAPAQATTPNPFDLLTGGDEQPRPAPTQFAPPTPAYTPEPAPAYPIDPQAPVPFPAAQNDYAPTPDWASSVAGNAPRQQEYPAPQPSKGRGNKFEFPSIPFLKRGGSGVVSTFTPSPDRELAQAIVDRGPMLIVMGSRKGGVGKTSYAAGIAIVAGQVLDTLGHKAAIVDANIANPDAWGQMNLREGAATVREVVAALTANREPPPPVHATTPALACYPESRETTEYSKTDVKRFADYLKRRYTFIVVDMSNRLPDPMAGPEAAAAAYWLEHADVLVLPTTSSKQDFNGVLDYLDVRDLPPTVVPYIVPKVKRNREHPVTQQYLAVIRDRVQSIVEVPDEADKVRFAGMEGIPVERVSTGLRSAYRELTETIVHVPPRVPV